MQLEGRLALFPLRELIEMVVYSSVKGVLELRSDDLTAQLFFRDGQPSHAVAGDLSGMHAVGRMFELADGDFNFHLGQEPDEETLWIDPHDLIARGEQMARQWKPLRPFVPSLNWVPALVDGAKTSQVQISEEIWPVLAAVDGRRSARLIAEELRVDTYDVCVALATLKHQGLINLAPAMSADALSTANDAEDKRGFFERLIERTLEEEARNPSSRYAPPEKRYVETD